MLHIMAAVYLVCFFISVCSSSIYIWSIKRHFQSHAYRTLNTNLAKIDLFWSDSKSKILPLKTDSILKDQDESLRSFLRVAIIACLTSLIGCLLLLLFIFSMKVLAQPRIEKRIFESDLAKDLNLDLGRIQEVVLNLQADFG